MKAIIKELGHMLEQICCTKRKHVGRVEFLASQS